MIIETNTADYASLLRGDAPRDFTLADTPIAPAPVLEMLKDVAAQVGEGFSPASWLVVEDGEVVGLCSITRPPEHGVLDIGYGISPSRQGRGCASRAVREVVAWALGRRDVAAITAETSPANLASQRVLERNGFLTTGTRIDEEDGPLVCWRRSTR